MSTALISMVKDEADVAEFFLRHAAYHVDHIYVADHGSTDGTREILDEIDLPLSVADLDNPGYWQSRYMTEMAQIAYADGHQWVIPADFDEIWHVGADVDRPIKDWLGGLAPDTHLVRAELYNHIPSAEDAAKNNPFKRIAWRQREHAPLPKVACRTHPSLVIHAGNHAAYLDGKMLVGAGLVVRHFSWRSPEQYLKKIVNGRAAYALTDLPEGTGAHWRMWEGASDEAILAHFDTWFYARDPKSDRSLIYDPTPYHG